MLAKWQKVGYVCFCYAGLAQLVEQRIRNAWVGRSNLLTGTNKKSAPKGAVFFIGYRKGRRTPAGRRNRVALRQASQCREDPQAKAQRHLLTGTNKKSAPKGAVFFIGYRKGRRTPAGRRNRVALRQASQCREDPQAKAQRHLLTGTNKKSAPKGAVFFIGYRKGRRTPAGRRNRVALRQASQCREDPQAKAQRHLLTGTNKKSAPKGAVFYWCGRKFIYFPQ